MTTSLAIGLSSWIIADGNYSNFASGDEAAFALAKSSISTLLNRSRPLFGLSLTVKKASSDQEQD